MYAARQLKGEDKAVALNKDISYLRPQRFDLLFEKNYFRNCSLTSDDAKRALDIYCQDRDYLKGKTTRVTAQHVPVLIIVPLPNTIRDRYKNVTLCADLFIVQGTPFLHIITRDLIFRTNGEVKNRSKMTMIKGLMRTLKLYSIRGFHVINIFADNEFECIRNELLPCNLNIAAKLEHVPEVERSVRTVKESIRYTSNGLPFK